MLLAGAGLSLLAIALSGAQSVSIPTLDHAPRSETIRVAGIPSPRAGIMITEGVGGSVVVPTGKSLVITGLGNRASSPTFLVIDNQSIWYTGALTPYDARIPAPGIVAKAGSEVAVSGFGTGRALGYFIDEVFPGRVRSSTLAGPEPAPNAAELRIDGIPDPRNAVLIREVDGVYRVPSGKRLVITGLGLNTNGATFLYFNDEIMWNNGSTGYQVPAPGIVVPLGFTVHVASASGSSFDSACAIGYLIDA